jgi:hypothetical protein
MARNGFRVLVLALGLFYVVLAIAGFASISDETNVGGNLRGGNPADLLWGAFGVTTVLNFIHFLLGGLTVIAGVMVPRSKLGTWAVATGFTLVLVYDIVSISTSGLTDPLAINWADFWLHLVTVVILVVVSVVPVSQPAGRTGVSHST